MKRMGIYETKRASSLQLFSKAMLEDKFVYYFLNGNDEIIEVEEGDTFDTFKLMSMDEYFSRVIIDSATMNLLKDILKAMQPANTQLKFPVKEFNASAILDKANNIKKYIVGNLIISLDEYAEKLCATNKLQLIESI